MQSTTITPGSRSDVGPEYRYKVIAYIAAKLIENPVIKDFVIFSKLKDVGEFDHLILKLWFEREPNPFIYLTKIKHKSSKQLLNIKEDIIKRINTFEYLLQSKNNIDVLRDVPVNNIKFWFFSNNNAHSSYFLNFTQLDRTNNDIVPFELTTGLCYKVHSSLGHRIYGNLYLFLKLPNVNQIVDEIAKICRITEATNIIDYVNDYFKETQLHKCGLTKTNFEIELLKIHLRNYQVTLANIIDVNEEQAHIWNKLTLEHELTIVDNIPDIKRIIFGCFVHKINDLFEYTLKWDACIYNEGKLDCVTVGKAKDFFQNSSCRQWLSPPEDIRSLIENLWICNELPLILKIDQPLPILAQYKHLNKRFLIINEVPWRSNEIASPFSHVFKNVADIRRDSLKNELLQNILISLQGRIPARFYDIIDCDENCAKEMKTSRILDLMKNRKVYLKKSGLDEAESTIFIIENDRVESHQNTNEMEMDDNYTSVINCKSNESECYAKEIEGNRKYKHHSICCLRSSTGMLEFLKGDRRALRRFLIDYWGDPIYCIEGNRPVPIIGKRVDCKPQVYQSRNLRKAIIPNSVFKTQEKRICLLSGDIDSLDSDIKIQLVKEDLDYNAKIKLENNENVLMDDKVQSVDEFWDKFSTVGCPLFHVKAVNGCMVLLNYKNCSNMSSYISYSNSVREDVFLKTNTSKLTVISGEPGIGKSSLLRSLSEATDEKNYILFCNLTDYRNSLTLESEKILKDPVDYIFSKFEGRSRSKLLYYIYQFQKIRKRLTLFIDAFDEILPMQRKSVLLFMKAITKSNVRVIVASRTFFDTILINNFEVQPIEVDNFSEIDYMKYFKNKGMLNINLKEVPTEFLQSPLFLTLLWFLFREGTLDFTKISKYQLYKNIIMKKVERYYRKTKQCYDPEKKGMTNDLLGIHRLIALMVIFGKDFVIEQKIVKDYGKLIKDFKALFKMKLGIVKHFNDDFPIFLHQSFAEFLTAEWLFEKYLDDYDETAQTVYKKMILEHDVNTRYLFDSMICADLKLHRAILEGNLNVVKDLTKEHKRNVKTIDKCGRNALLLASSYCFDKNYDILEEVVVKSYGHKINFPMSDFNMKWNWVQHLDNFSKDRFFDQACNYNLSATIAMYLSHKERSINSNHVLSAYRSSNLDVIYALVTANTSLLKEHFIPITNMAIERGRMDIAYDFIELKYNCNIVDAFKSNSDPSSLTEFVKTQTNNEFTALHLACMIGIQEIVAELIYDDDKRLDNYSPSANNFHDYEDSAHETPADNYSDTERSLNSSSSDGISSEDRSSNSFDDDYSLSLGEFSTDCYGEGDHPLFAKDIFGNIPLHYVCMEGNTETFTLLETRMIYCCCENDAGDIPLHLAFRFLNHEVIEMLLLRTPEDINALNCKGETSLHAVASIDWQQIVKNKARSAANILVRRNITPVDEKDYNFNKILMRSQIDNKSESLVQDTLHKQAVTLIDTLLKAGSHITEQDDDGNTALHLAYRSNNRVVLEYLIDKSEEIAFIKNSNGLSVLEIAQRDRKTDIVNYIQQHNFKITQTINIRNNSLLSEAEESFIRRELKFNGQRGQTFLHAAAISGRSDIIFFLLEKGLPADGRDDDGHTALHFVNSARDAQLLISKYANCQDAFRKSNGGETPLCMACYNGYIDVVKFLLMINGDVSTKNKYGQTPLHLSAIANNLDIAAVLLDKGAGVNDADNSQMTALHMVIPKGSTFFVELLLENNANACLQDNWGSTPLHLASRYGHIKLVERLIKGSPEAFSFRNSDGYSAYDIACIEGKCDVVNFFLKSLSWKACLQISGDVLYKMVQMGHLEILKLLLCRNILCKYDFGYKDDEGNSLLHIASLRNHTNFMRLLFENGLEPNSLNDNHETPLHLIQSTECTEMLLSKYGSCSNPHTKTKFDETPLHKAAAVNVDVVRTLLYANADASAKDRFGWTPLQIATWANKLNAVEALLEREVNVNATNNYSGTALHIAVTKDLLLVKALLNAGADIYAENKHGDLALRRNLNTRFRLSENNLPEKDNNTQTVLDIACIYGKCDIIDFLLKNCNMVKWSNISRTALYETIARGDLWCLEMLFQEDLIPGNYLQDEDIDGNTLLSFAVMHGCEDIVSFLVEKGADINAGAGTSPLTMAILKGHAGIVNTFLTSSKVSIENQVPALELAVLKNNVELVNVLLSMSTNINNEVILHFALVNASESVLETLVSHATDFSMKNKDGYNALEYMCFQASDSRIEHLLRKYPHLKKCCITNDKLFDLVEKGRYTALRILFNEKILTQHELDYTNYAQETLLHTAVYFKESDIIALLLEKGASVNRRDIDGYIPLHIAKTAEDVKLLLNKQSPVIVNVRSRSKHTPLHIASRDGHLEVVQALLLAKADILSSDRHGNTPLHFAVYTGQIDIVRVLIENGANVNATNKTSETALHFAALKNHRTIVKVLLNNGADIKLQDKTKNTAFHIACEERHTDIINCFLNQPLYKELAKTLDKHINFESKIVSNNHKKPTKECSIFPKILFDIINQGHSDNLQKFFDLHILNRTHLRWTNEDGYTVLFFAVTKGKVDIINILLQNGANANATNSDSRAALHIAAAQNRSSILLALLDYNANIELRDMYGNTALHFAVLGNHINAMRVLIERGANTNAVNNDLVTGLHTAASENLLPVLEMLLNYNARCDLTDENGNTALHLAYANGNIHVIEVLTNHSDILTSMRNFNSHTPFEFACLHGTIDALNTLLQHYSILKKQTISADILYNIVDRGDVNRLQLVIDRSILNEETKKFGKSLLHIATIKGHADIIHFLLNKGIKVDTLDIEGFRPLHFAQSDNIAQILLAAYPNISDAHEKSKTGRTPLHMASRNGYADVVQILLLKNAEVLVKDRCGWTPLLLAAYANHESCAKILLKYGADANELNNWNETPLHLSVQNGNLAMVEILLEYGADVHIKDSIGNTALHSIMNMYRWHSWFSKMPLCNWNHSAGNVLNLVHTLVRCTVDRNVMNYDEESVMDIMENLKSYELLAIENVPKKRRITEEITFPGIQKKKLRKGLFQAIE